MITNPSCRGQKSQLQKDLEDYKDVLDGVANTALAVYAGHLVFDNAGAAAWQLFHNYAMQDD